MFIFQHPAADRAVGDLISWEKLTLQGLILHLSEVSYTEYALLVPVWAFAIQWVRLMHRTKMVTWWLSCCNSPQMFDCSNLPCLFVITHQAVYTQQFVYDRVHSVTYRTTPENIEGINISNLWRKTGTIENIFIEKESVSKQEFVIFLASVAPLVLKHTYELKKTFL